MARRLSPLRFLLCALAIFAVLPSQLHAQDGPTRWQALGSPGGRVTLLAAGPDGRAVFAVTVAEVNRNADETQARETGTPARADALYKSEDGGRRWQAVTNDLPPGEISLLFVDRESIVWVGLQRQGEVARLGELWSSADGGESWRISELDRRDLALRNVTQDPGGELLLLANGGADPAENLLYRRQADSSWSAASLNLPDAASSATAAQVSANSTGPRLFLTTDFGDLLVSTDNGRNWIVKGNRPPGALTVPALVAFQPDQPSVALLVRPAESGLTLERSQDGGDTWSTTLARGLPGGQIVPGSLVAGGNRVVLMTTDRGVYRSADGGSTWQALEGALDSAYVYQILPLSGEGSLLAGTAYGLFASGDRGALWQQMGSGLPHNSAVLGLLTHPNRPDQVFAFVRAVGATDASLMLVSRDGGATWLPAGPGGAWTDATAWAVDPQNPDHLYAAGFDYVATSRDAGASWAVTAAASSARRTTVAVAPSDPQRVYADGAPPLVSEDGGDTWSALPSAMSGDGMETTRGVAVHPGDAEHVWFGAQDGVRESRDGGQSLERFGLDGSAVRWLAAAAGEGSDLTLFAGAQDGGIMRWSSATGDWQPAQTGLPAGSNIIAFAADPGTPGLLWATRDGGGLYASADNGASWQNVGQSAGDNLGLSFAPNYSADGGWFLGTATAGTWLLGPERRVAGATQTPPGPTSAPSAGSRDGVDARVEVVWPHSFAPLTDASLANVGIRLFLPRSLEVPSCGWRPGVQLWRAVDTEPAAPVGVADQRTVDGHPFPYWDANDVDVSPAQETGSRVYFFVQVDGVDTATSVWAHGADARTYFPEQLVPSGIATGAITDVDARIQIVWPHDESGAYRDTQDANLANVAVTLFRHGTRLSVPPRWRPEGITLVGAWNSEVSRPFDVEPVVSTRQSGAITFPVWEFYDVPVERARDAMTKLYLWTVVDGLKSYPTIWAHGADARTFFPVADEPVQGCLP